MYFKKLLRDYQFKKSELECVREKIIRHYIEVLEKETKLEVKVIKQGVDITNLKFCDEEEKNCIVMYIDNENMEIFNLFTLGDIETDLNLEKIKELIER